MTLNGCASSLKRDSQLLADPINDGYRLPHNRLHNPLKI